MYSKRLALLAMILSILLLAMSASVTNALPMEGRPGQENDTALAALAEDDFRSTPVMFIENVGQWDEIAKFQVWGGTDNAVWLAEDAIWITVMEPEVGDQKSEVGDQKPGESQGRVSDDAPRRGINIKLSFPGANPHPAIEAFDHQDTVVSYFMGDDAGQWRSDVPVWGGVRYVDLWPGVDLVVGADLASVQGRRLASPVPWRFVAKEGADVSAVRMQVEGADGAEIEGGWLHLATEVQELSLSLPRADFVYEIETLAKHGPASSLEVYPGDVASTMGSQSSNTSNGNPADLLYSTFLGGSNKDSGFGVAVDGNGSAYVLGVANSSNFPTTPGAFDTSYNGGDLDAFVVKLNPAGSGLVYATFLGGNDNDYGQGIAVDGSGSAYVAGNTWSANFPTTPNAFDTSHNGGSDAFMVKLNPAGSGLVYATLLGGSDDDYGHGVVVGGNGSAYMAGETDSSNFPTTPGAFDTSYNGGDGADAFVARLNSAGSGLVYATYLGGSRFDAGYGITVNVSGSAYVTGETGSSNFPTTSGAFDTSYNGGDIDAYVVKLNPAGSGLAYATFLGGSGGDWGNLITVNVNGSAYVVGPTGSSNFPTTPGSFDTGYNGGDRDAFVVKLNPAGGGLAYATFLGGNGTDFGNGIAVDGSGSAYVVGRTGSSDFPTTPGSFDTSYNGGDRDAYVAKLNPSGSGLAYATFLGGSRSDSGYGSIAVDGSGSAYVTGQTHSSNFPTTSGAFDTSYNGGDRDAYVAKLAIPTPLYLPLILLGIPQPPPGARTLISIADTTLLEGYPSSNLGDASDMWVGYDDELDPNAKIARGLIKFDLSSVPNGATIQNATLR
ncbi:MAG TPA: DNRLRE domain-containing protein, partial [Caldilineae bacterium]|nr:DNRLRE domain-containing protein [Caldilineae bacterium]